MKPVFMTVKHDPESGTYGDCFRCCVASLLNLPAEAVPHFLEKGPESFGTWGIELQRFLALHSMAFLELVWPKVDWSELSNSGFNTYHIITGTSPRGFDHSVVALNGKIVHDPHPDGGGLVAPMKDDGEYHYGFLIVTGL